MGSATSTFRLILADTSVWIDHIRQGDDLLFALLENQRILTHPYVIGEIALGSLRSRAERLATLHDLPSVIPARHSEVMRLIESERLFGTGLGYVDAHLLTSAIAMDEVAIWSRDKKMVSHTARLNVAFEP